MEEICKAYFLNTFKSKGDGDISGIIKSKEKYESFLLELSSNGFSFSIRNSETKSTTTESVFFLESGIPWTSLQRIYLQCCHGNLYYEINKSNSDQDHPAGKKRRFRIKDSKKIGCPSKLNVKVRHVYPEYQVDPTSQSTWMKHKMAQEMKSRISQDLNLKKETWYFIEGLTKHNHEISGQQILIQPELKARISQLVENGVTSIHAIKLQLKEKAREIFQGQQGPDILNSSFFPNDKVIYSHVYNTLFEIKGSKSDQEALEKKINMWKKNNDLDEFYFRKYKNEDDKTTPLLFCQQTKEQKKLMELYGNNSCILDTTYKTTKYSLPLFFIVVKTNVKLFMVVGSFLCQNEDENSIAEGLKIFSEWNPHWHPQQFITDYCEAEMNAISFVFPHSKHYICSFHREQAWVRWTKKKGNIEYGSPEEVISMFRSFLEVKKEELDMKIDEMEKSELWKKNKKVQTYFSNVWLCVAEKWMPCLVERTFLNNILSNNGVEVQNRIFKKSYFSQTTDKSLTGTVSVLIEKFLPDSFKKFKSLNLNASSGVKRYNSEIPAFLHNRPHQFIKHLMPRYSQASMEFSKEDCTLTGHLEAKVTNRYTNNVYTVDFANVRCNCPDFQKWQNLCKHFCACFVYVAELPFDVLPDAFKNNPMNRILNFEIADQTFETSENADQHSEQLPPLSKPPYRLASLREELKDIINITYNIEESEDVSLEAFFEQTARIKRELDALQKKEENLPLLKKRKRETSTGSSDSLRLPMPSKHEK